MRPAYVVLLLVAVVTGGLAAFMLLTGGETPTPQVVTELVAEPKTQILVASGPIGVGQRLDASAVQWQDWPETALRSEYITVAASPEAPDELTDAVARFEFFPGEPIREEKLVRADQGYLSAVLPQGMRGVSISVSAESGAGGFIMPNDRVDVVLSRSSDVGRLSETILANVKVLAIGKRLGEMGTTGGTEGGDGSPQASVFDGTVIATLELAPPQAELVINAASTGEISLVLRSIVDFASDPSTAMREVSTNQPIRMIRYGSETSVFAAGNANSQPAPVAYVPPLDVGPSSSMTQPAQPAPLQ